MVGPQISITGDLPKPPRKRKPKRRSKVPNRRGPATIVSSTCSNLACESPGAPVAEGRHSCAGCIARLEKRAAALKTGRDLALTPPPAATLTPSEIARMGKRLRAETPSGPAPS